MHIRPFLIAALLAASLLFLLGGNAQAHSLLVSSNPSSGQKLTSAPATVQMTFSEGVEPAFSSFAVIDRTRKHHEVGAPTIDRVKGLVTITLEPNLSPGDYIVQWKVVSVIDGHLTQGSFAFNVIGAASAPTPVAPLSTGGVAPTPEPTLEPLPLTTDTGTGNETTGESTAPGVLDVAVRWLDTLLAACLVGGAFFGLFVVPRAIVQLPDGREGRGEVRASLEMRFVRGALISAILLILTLGGELVLQATRVTESDLFSVFGQQGVLSAVLDSSFGSSLRLRAVIILVVFVLLLISMFIKRTGIWLWTLLILLGAGYFWAQTESAHATALSEQPDAGILQALAPFANLLHLLSTAVWIGGIFYFVLIFLPVLRKLVPQSRAAVLRDGISRFSQLALVTVPVVALSGLVIFLAEEPSVESTLETDYGHDILIKVGLLLVLMIPAAYNLRRIGPGLALLRDKLEPAFRALAQGFRRSIRVEALLVSTVLIFSALLTLSAPATDPSVYAGEAAASARALEVSTTATAVAVAALQPVESSTPEATATTAPPATLALTQTVRGVQVALNLVHSGLNDDVNVGLLDSHGPIIACGATPTANADCVITTKLTFTELDDNASNSLTAPDAGNGNYALPEGPYLPLDGTWQIVVTVRRYNQPDDITAAFRYDVEEGSLTGKVSDYVNIDASTNPDPPQSGQVALTFHLTDNNGQPVNDATIQVQGIMPAHGHVTEVKQMDNSNGTYTTSLLMPMSGGWSVELSISRPGHDTVAAEVSLDLATSSFDLTPYPSPNAPAAAP